MKVCYTAIYKLHGANSLPDEAESEHLLALQTPAFTARLTTNPEPYFLHVDKSAALGTQLLKGMFAPDKAGTLQQRLTAEIEEIKAHRSKGAGGGVYLVFEGEADIPTPEFRARRDTDEFAVSLDDIDKSDIRERFRPAMQSVLGALGLSLPANSDRRVERVGNVVYLVDPDDGKPIYTFVLAGGSLRASTASALTRNVITEAVTLVPKLATEEAMARPTNLLITSLDKATNELQAFISAWSALEIFVASTFRAKYKELWFRVMRNGAPDSATLVFERLDEVMRDKYGMANKFLIIASLLDTVTATTDAAEFKRLKSIRHDLVHGLDIPASPLPTEAVQKLLLKYMKLHLTAQE